jgi:hypothetical protein
VIETALRVVADRIEAGEPVPAAYLAAFATRAPAATHSWRKEGDAQVARVAIGDLALLELGVSETAWWITVDGQEKQRGTCSSKQDGRRATLETVDLMLRQATAKTEAWLFEILRRG